MYIYVYIHIYMYIYICIYIYIYGAPHKSGVGWRATTVPPALPTYTMPSATTHLGH